MARWPLSLTLSVAVLLATVFSRDGGLAQTPAALSMPEQLKAQRIPEQLKNRSMPKLTGMVALRVDSVLAANTEGGIDPRLQPLGRQLKSLNYSTYRLIEQKKGETPCGKMTTFLLPGVAILNIEPLTADNDMIFMKLVFFLGDGHLIADLKLMNHSGVLLGGPRYGEGTLIISVRADTLARVAPATAASAKPER